MFNNRSDEKKNKLKETINNNNNNDQMNELPTTDSKLLRNFTKTIVRHAIVSDARVRQSESDLIEEKRRNKKLEQQCCVQKNKLKDLGKRLGDSYDRIKDLKQKKDQQFSLARTKVVNASGRGAVLKWGNEVVFVIIQQLAVDAKPTAIQKSLESFHFQYTGNVAEEVPSVNYIRGCRLVGFIVNDILGAIRLGLASNWRSMFSDGTNRRQCALYNLLFDIKDDWSKGFESPMIVSSCIIMMEETAEGIHDAIHRKV